MGLATILLAACETTPEKPAEPVAEPVDTGVEAAPTEPVVSEPMGPTPGTQEHLNETVGDRVFFGFDRYDLTPEAQATLRAQAEWLKEYPTVNVLIEGHCDERGTREYNLALGERRANAIKNYLVALGIDADRIDTVSYGKERPAVLGSYPEAWAKNRRGVMVVQ
ncbi:MAG: peptidoglycan-associated lipoprotein Pal [Alphaproteobacteria bacterium]|nr:MAG: peptidoglycan-associated lipoprotein Pal [Alphaproteobacteria bacterium]